MDVGIDAELGWDWLGCMLGWMLDWAGMDGCWAYGEVKLPKSGRHSKELQIEAFGNNNAIDPNIHPSIPT